MLQLWQQNQGCIARIAMHFQGHEDTEDLMQQGYIGLCNAVDGYNPDEGTLFMTYAWFWIKQSMQRYIEECGSVVRIPVNLRSKIGKYKKLIAAFQSQYGRKPTDDELRHLLDFSQEQLENLKKASVIGKIGSLDVPIGEEGEISLSDLVPGQENPESEVVDRMQRGQLQETLWDMVDDLTDKQRRVILLRFQEGMTLQKTGDIIGTNKGNVLKIQNRALSELRRSRRARELWSFM